MRTVDILTIKTEFNVKWSFKVTYFGVNEKPMRDYILPYNNVGLICKGFNDIATERTENRRFDGSTTSQRIRANIRTIHILPVT